MQDVKSKIETRYRVRLILDNLPITTYDLERGPESVRPGVWMQSASCFLHDAGRWHWNLMTMSVCCPSTCPPARLKMCICFATGFDLGFWADNRHFINNHLMFKILVYKTNGQYTKARKRYEEMEAASVVEVRNQHRHSCWDTGEARIGVARCAEVVCHRMQGGARKLQSAGGIAAPSVDGRQLKALWSKKPAPPPPMPAFGKEDPM